MAKLSLPSLTLAQCGSGYPAPQQRMRDLRDWDLIIQRRPIQIEIAETTTTSNDTNGDTVASFYMYVPTASVGLNFNLQVEAKVTANTGHWWIEDNSTSTASTKVDDLTDTSYAESGPVALTIGSTWGHTVRLIDVLAYIETSGTFSLKNVDRLTGWFEDDAG